MDKRLIVNADDFGMTIDVSRGIIVSARAGLVRSTSVMANTPDFGNSLSELELSGVPLDVGLHANLTWGRPVSDPTEIPSLVDSNGIFLPRARLLAKSMVKAISPEEAYREIWAQCAKLASRRKGISHIDGHHHVHAFPGIAAAAERVAREFRIPYVRAPREGSWSPWRRNAVRRLAVFMLAASSPRYWSARGFRTSDYFGGFSLGSCPDLKRRWIDTLKMIPEGLCEIMVHPGYCSCKLDSYSERRTEEIPILTDLDLMREIAEQGIKLESPSSVL